MVTKRRDFIKDSLAALGFIALPGGLFAAPVGWKPKKKPNLVVGILSDTHLQSGWDGVKPHGGFPLTYVTNAMKLFRERNIDAFMHLGDMAHRGKNVEAQYHRDIFGGTAILITRFRKGIDLAWTIWFVVLVIVFALCIDLKAIPFRPYVPTTQKLLIVSFAVWSGWISWRMGGKSV